MVEGVRGKSRCTLRYEGMGRCKTLLEISLMKANHSIAFSVDNVNIIMFNYCFFKVFIVSGK